MRCRSLQLLPLLVLTALPGSAAIIYTNVSGTYGSTFTGWMGTGVAYAATTFVPTGNGQLTSIDLGASYRQTLSGILVGIGLYQDSAGAPGTLLESWTTLLPTYPLGSTDPVVTLTSVSNPLLTIGTKYWLVTTSNTPSVYLYANDTSTMGGYWYGSAINSLTHVGGTAPGLLVNAVPEPASLALLGSGLLLLALFAHRRRIAQTES